MLGLPPESDNAIMVRVQAGENELFSQLIGRHQAAMLRVARSRLGQVDLAEDAVQEAFLAAFKFRHTFRPEASFRTWLWTILLNRCRNQLGRQAKRPRVAVWTDELHRCPEEGGPAHERTEPLAAEPLPLSRLLAKERSELLERLLAQLSPVQADALRLRFFGSLKFQEIADTMNCSLGTAKNRVQWGLIRLAELLASEEAAAPPNPASPMPFSRRTSP